MIRISVMQGDARMNRLVELLDKDGIEAHLFSANEIESASAYGQIIVLPLKGMNPDVFNGYLNDGQILITGNDFLEREDFSILNAIPTVEGALQIAMEKTIATIHGSNMLVIGNGRIGKLMARSLASLGAEVTVSARKSEDLAWIKALGYNAANTNHLEGTLGSFDCIFNTVPYMILPYTRLTELKKNCLIIDLASHPGGVDFKAAANLGINTEWALSLPGKVAPESAALYLRDTLYQILHEREVSL